MCACHFYFRYASLPIPCIQLQKPATAPVSPAMLHNKLVMVPCILLTLLLVSTISAEITCIPSESVPSIASCNVAIQNLARYLLPCLGRETVEVGLSRHWNPPDLQFPVRFSDNSDQPPKTPRCGIVFIWNGDNSERESIVPGSLQTFATSMKNQCIAASPPQLAKGIFDSKGWISVQYRTFVEDENGGLAISGVNGTLISGLNYTATPVGLPPLNPTDACTIDAGALYGVGLDGSQPSVETS